MIDPHKAKERRLLAKTGGLIGRRLPPNTYLLLPECGGDMKLKRQPMAQQTLRDGGGGTMPSSPSSPDNPESLERLAILQRLVSSQRSKLVLRGGWSPTCSRTRWLFSTRGSPAAADRGPAGGLQRASADDPHHGPRHAPGLDQRGHSAAEGEAEGRRRPLRTACCKTSCGKCARKRPTKRSAGAARRRSRRRRGRGAGAADLYYGQTDATNAQR